MRLKLASTLENRDSTLDQDARILNGLVESQGGRRKDDKSMVIKRPGCVSSYSLATGQGGATAAQGLFVMLTPSAPGISGTVTLIGVRGDVLTIPVS